MIGQAPQEQTQPSPDDLPRLMEAYAKHGDLATLFQIHEMNQMRQAAQRNSAMGNNVPQETIMAREVETYQNGGIRDLARRVGGAAQHQSQQAQQNMNNVAQAGLPSQPTPDVAQAAYSGGGIVAFAGPEGSVVPEVDDSSVRQKFWSWVASLGVDAAKLAGPQLDKLREKYLEMGGDLGAKVEEALSSAPTMAEIGDSMPRSDLGGQQRLDLSPVTSAITDTANGAMDATQEFLAGMLPTPEPNAELADMGGAPGSNGAQPPRITESSNVTRGENPHSLTERAGRYAQQVADAGPLAGIAAMAKGITKPNPVGDWLGKKMFEFQKGRGIDPANMGVRPKTGGAEAEQMAAAQTPPPEGIAAVQGAAPTASPQMNPETLADINQKIQGAAPAYDPMKGVEAIANPDLRAAIENKASPTAGPQIDPRSPDTRGIASTVQKTPEQLAQERYNAAIGKAEDPKKLAMDKLIATLAGGVGVAGQESGAGASGARMAMAGKAEGDSQQARQIARRKEELEYERGVAREDSVMAQEQANSIALLGEEGATRLEQVQATEAIRLKVQQEANRGRLAEANVGAANRYSVAELNAQAGVEKMAAQYGFEAQLDAAGAKNDRYNEIMGTLVTDGAYREMVAQLEADYEAGWIFAADRVPGEINPETGRANPVLEDAVAAATVDFIEARMGRVYSVTPAQRGIAGQAPADPSGPVDAAAYFQ